MLDKISANVSSQLTQQSELGVEIVPQDGVRIGVRFAAACGCRYRR